MEVLRGARAFAGHGFRPQLLLANWAREYAELWFAEVQRRGLHRQLGHASLQLYATQALGFSDNRYYQFKRLADDLDRLDQGAAGGADDDRDDAGRVGRAARTGRRT
jgi:hypothetical protein